MTVIICLAIGWLCFIIYNRKKGYSFRDLLTFSWKGILGAKVVLLTLALVGVLTGLWRSAGTIAYIVTVSISLVQPNILLLCIFLLNALVSFLIGTSFGTAATMGVICMILANAAGFSPVLSGGAVLSGIFFGDRCSPVSSSAVLVASVTKTDLYDNLKNMFLSARVPFTLTCIIYLVMGFLTGKSGSDAVAALPDFSVEFHLVPATLLPAIIVLVLALFRVNVRTAILISCVAAAFVCLFVQGQSLAFLGKTILFGFTPGHEELVKLIGGGGLLSMKRVLCIVGISSTYSGMIKNTDMADQLSHLANQMHERFSRIGCMTIVSIISSMIGCNQTLAIMLTEQFCESLYVGGDSASEVQHSNQNQGSTLNNTHNSNNNPRYDICEDNSRSISDVEDNARAVFANDIEDTVVVISPMIPWCIAGAVPIAAIGAPATCLFAACYLYLIPVCRYFDQRKY
ncbi:MAG: sodium:proton antiporter [Dorea sp.]|nr:sodium:proton antiporter [Dorea sp.]